MKSKDLAVLIGTGLAAVIVGFILSSILIKSPPLSRTVDTMGEIDRNFENAHEGVYEEVFPDETIDTFSEIRASETDDGEN